MNIIAKESSDAINRTAQDGGVLQRSLIADTTQVVLMHDGFSPHTAQKRQQLCRENLRGIWGKRSMAREEPEPQSNQKYLGDPARQGQQDDPGHHGR